MWGKWKKNVDTVCSVGEHTIEQSYRSNTWIMTALTCMDAGLCFISHMLADLKDFKKVNEIYAKCEFCGSYLNF